MQPLPKNSLASLIFFNDFGEAIDLNSLIIAFFVAYLKVLVNIETILLDM